MSKGILNRLKVKVTFEAEIDVFDMADTVIGKAIAEHNLSHPQLVEAIADEVIKKIAFNLNCGQPAKGMSLEEISTGSFIEETLLKRLKELGAKLPPELEE